ncbi:SURF1 family protein [Amaricoccus sp.]|uniref:SURF1 family protein n=1 Tax=Amaricoccus sp. TaxID=1872485 RepID=UPI001B62445E|nr:SURF1 family protein [Amaricoccus sp.]MBP7001484.1 SURF1 family protein [Amaricoccus sp.]
MTRRMIGPLIFGLAGVAILIALGVWQLHRLEWKRGVLAEIEARMTAAATDVPASPTEAADEYRHVAVAGTLEPGEVHVYTSAPPWGVGYRIVAPLRLGDGRRVLLDRGFVPIADKEAPRPPGRIRIEGALLWPDETDGWTAAPDLDKNIWLARDVPAMAAALGTEPVLIVASATDDPTGPTPLPVGVNIPNDHLQYALTWFSLAAVWAVMTGYLLWRIKRRTV